MGARKISFPDPYAEDGKVSNNKRVLYNKVIAMLDEAGLGFTPWSMDDGKNFINALTNILYLDSGSTHGKAEGQMF